MPIYQQNGDHFEFQDGCYANNLIKMSTDTMSRYVKINNIVHFMQKYCYMQVMLKFINKMAAIFNFNMAAIQLTF